MKKLLSPFVKEKKIIHRVGEESLLDIALKYGVAPRKIVQSNGLTVPPKTGEILYVERGEGQLYFMQPTDTLKKIAGKFCVSEEELVKENGEDAFFPYSLIEIPKRGE